jgi:D-3-phosphoglycerate dehydrogenase
LHLSLTVETRAIIDETAIRRMKRGIWFINTSRGGLVDEEALVRALVDERVGAAALDVFAEEPLAPSHPLTRLPNVILGSHNASNTAEAVARTNEAAIRNLLRGLGKEPA